MKKLFFILVATLFIVSFSVSQEKGKKGKVQVKGVKATTEECAKHAATMKEDCTKTCTEAVKGAGKKSMKGKKK